MSVTYSLPLVVRVSRPCISMAMNSKGLGAESNRDARFCLYRGLLPAQLSHVSTVL